MNYLTFAPHPDDEIIGCGGYLHRLLEQGNKVDVAYVTIPNEIRRDEIQLVNKFMNFSNIYLLDQPERNLNLSTSFLESIITTIRKSKPDQIILPHKNESDNDHKMVFNMVLEGIFLANSNFLIKENEEPHKTNSIVGYEIWAPIQNPQFFVDITDSIDSKEAAMKIYGSQMDARNYISLFKGLNSYRASVKGVDGFMEAYEVYLMQDHQGG